MKETPDSLTEKLEQLLLDVARDSTTQPTASPALRRPLRCAALRPLMGFWRRSRRSPAKTFAFDLSRNFSSFAI